MMHTSEKVYSEKGAIKTNKCMCRLFARLRWPQVLAYLFAIAVIFYAWGRRNKKDLLCLLLHSMALQPIKKGATTTISGDDALLDPPLIFHAPLLTKPRVFANTIQKKGNHKNLLMIIHSHVLQYTAIGHLCTVRHCTYKTVCYFVNNTYHSKGSMSIGLFN